MDTLPGVRRRCACEYNLFLVRSRLKIIIYSIMILINHYTNDTRAESLLFAENKSDSKVVVDYRIPSVIISFRRKMQFSLPFSTRIRGYRYILTGRCILTFFSFTFCRRVHPLQQCSTCVRIISREDAY